MRRFHSLLLAAGLVAAPVGVAAKPSDQKPQQSFFESFSWAATKGRLGATVMSLSPELKRHFGSSDGAGVLVSYVEPGSPAQKAGLAVGDVITHVAGKTVGDPSDVFAALVDTGKTARVDVRVLRDRRPLALDVALESEARGPAMSRLFDLDWVKRFLDGARDGAARPAT